MRRRVFQQALLSLMLAAAATASHAVAINLTFARPLQSSVLSSVRHFVEPGVVRGGGSVEDSFNLAARMWESLLHDDRVFNITVGWVPNDRFPFIAIAAPGDDRHNEIGLAVGQAVHYADPNPLDDAEFSGFVTRSLDLGGGLVDVARGYTGGPGVEGFDLLTSALHEIGHVLGNPLDQAPRFGAVGFPVDTGPYAGTVLPCVRENGICSHLPVDLGGALMDGAAGGLAYARTLISGADLLFVATDGHFTDVNWAAVAPRALPEPASWMMVLLGWVLLAAVPRRR